MKQAALSYSIISAEYLLEKLGVPYNIYTNNQ